MSECVLTPELRKRGTRDEGAQPQPQIDASLACAGSGVFIARMKFTVLTHPRHAILYSLFNFLFFVSFYLVSSLAH